MSAVTRFKQSVSHGKERKAHQPLSTSAWATPRSVLTCIAYICLVTPSALGVGLPLRPWNMRPARHLLEARFPNQFLQPAH
ncbi:hypothetical protein E2C01_032585 [Portunus trituberculatus]|uniref:Uncharacterized protein n=1 Tax=Portunus trituberculatus TaxID=210409 RepID=A0A5B7F141_PORTR|nr:hypothetical protein [Portunus trituberculatus]